MRFPRFRRVDGWTPFYRTFSLAAVSGAFACVCVFSANHALAQAPTPSANPFGGDGGFEKIAGTEEVLWDGVNSSNQLAVPTFSPLVVTERSAYAPLAMPPSVAVADLNGDGKPDLLVASPAGYYFFYPNIGTPTAPAFGNAEVLPLFLSLSYKIRERYFDREVLDQVRFCPRIGLAEWRGRGVPDLMVGNYLGELYLIPNEGGATRASFRQPPSLDAARIPTDDRGRLWGNLLSPVGYDWNGNGHLDLILGEGTYSANVVRVFENLGGSNPKFSVAKACSYLAYGDGREQLLPAVVDYNGDGKPDLLIADRTREIGVYLNTGAKAGESLARTSTISFGGNSKLPSFAAPCVADFNGDGLFDIVMGLDNGHIGVSFNTGSKGQPQFGPIQELKGQDRIGRIFKRPNGWRLNTRADYGNAMGYITVVDAKDDPASVPPEGTNCLKVGYYPTANTVFPMAQDGIPGMIRRFTFARTRVTLEVGKPYTLTFKAKGTGMEKMRATFYHIYDDYPGGAKNELDDRNRSHRVGERVAEYVQSTNGEFSCSGNWSNITKTINVKYKNPALQQIKEMTGDIEIEMWSKSASDVAYFDDFQLVQAKN